MAGVKTQGCTIELGDSASPIVYAVIGGVTSFQGPTGSRQVIDTTTLASTAKGKDVGIPDMGQISADFNFLAAETALIDTWDAFLAGDVQNFIIRFSDSPNTTFSFSGFVLNFSFAANMDDIVRGSFTIEIDGDVTDNLA